MADFGDDLQRLLAGAELRGTQCKAGTLTQPRIHRDPAKSRAAVENAQIKARARLQLDHQMAGNCALAILDKAERRTLPRRHQNFLARHRPYASQRIEVRVAEGLVLASWKGQRFAHAATAS